MQINLDHIIYAVDELGLPKGLFIGNSLLGFQWGFDQIWWDYESSGAWVWLAAFLAHCEAEAEKRYGMEIYTHEAGVFWVTEGDFQTETVKHEKGNAPSRLCARLAALVSGLKAVKENNGGN